MAKTRVRQCRRMPHPGRAQRTARRNGDERPRGPDPTRQRSCDRAHANRCYTPSPIRVLCARINEKTAAP
eukprot:11169596-Lingulodinium_polyedra.AAC.1